MKDTIFFNKESTSYSAKRYPRKSITFTQFFFKRRLELTLRAIRSYVHKDPLTVLELGCADGVVAAAVSNRFSKQIKKFRANDIAPDMIERAREQFSTLPIEFNVRTDSKIQGSYDVILEIGVLNYTNLMDELSAVAGALSSNGIYICSIAGNSSLQFRLKSGEGYMHLLSYVEYENFFKNHFTIRAVYPVGFFIPLLWKLPAVARVVQPVFEILLNSIIPSLALEKIYVLKRK